MLVIVTKGHVTELLSILCGTLMVMLVVVARRWTVTTDIMSPLLSQLGIGNPRGFLPL